MYFLYLKLSMHSYMQLNYTFLNLKLFQFFYLSKNFLKNLKLADIATCLHNGNSYKTCNVASSYSFEYEALIFLLFIQKVYKEFEVRFYQCLRLTYNNLKTLTFL